MAGISGRKAGSNVSRDCNVMGLFVLTEDGNGKEW